MLRQVHGRPRVGPQRGHISLLEKPVPISTVKGITGFFGERMEVNRQYLVFANNYSILPP